MPKLIPALCLPVGKNGSILVAEAWNVSPHLETGLEIAARLAAVGHSVGYLHYGDAIDHVEYRNFLGFDKKASVLGPCSPQTRGIKILHKFKTAHNLPIKFLKCPATRNSLSTPIDDQYLLSIEALKSFCWEGSNDIGLAIASSLVSTTLNSEVIPSEHRELCQSLAVSFLQAYTVVSQILAVDRFDAIVLFNGRFPCVKGAVRAAKNASVPVFYHERGCSVNHFSLRDYQPHDRILLQKDISTAWDSANPEAGRQIGKRYYQEKRRGIERAWTSFTSRQEAGLATKIVDKARNLSSRGKIVVYFSSSDDEFIAIGDLFESNQFEWKSQKEAVGVLAEVVGSLGYSLIIRVHPHLERKACQDRDSWNQLSFLRATDRVFVITSDSIVSTYELIDAADVVVTYGSTVGIEAVYWGKPSVLLWNSFYDELNASVHKATTKQHLRDLLVKADALPVYPNSSLPYGYYMSTFGYEYCLYRPESLFSGRFCGLSLSEEPVTLRHLLYNSCKRLFLGLLRRLARSLPWRSS